MLVNAHRKLPKTVTTQILEYLDSKELTATIPQVNRNWKMTLANEQYQLKEMAESRLKIHHMIFQHCDLFKNETPDSVGLTLLEGGWTNRTFVMKQNTNEYIVRLAGIKSDALVNRKNENLNAKIASNHGINPAILFFSSLDGTQVSEYIKNPVTLSPIDFKDFSNIKKAVTTFKVIHESSKHFSNEIDLFERIRHMIFLLQTKNISLPKAHQACLDKMQEIEALYRLISIDQVSCHMDATPYNFIYSKNNPDKFLLIDWEYSGRSDLVWDLTYFAISAEMNQEQEKYFLQAYFETDNIDPIILQRFSLYKPMVYHWMSLWSTIQIMNENYKGGYDNLLKYEKLRLTDCENSYESDEFKQALQSLKENCQSQSLKHTMSIF